MIGTRPGECPERLSVLQEEEGHEGDAEQGHHEFSRERKQASENATESCGPKAVLNPFPRDAVSKLAKGSTPVESTGGMSSWMRACKLLAVPSKSTEANTCASALTKGANKLSNKPNVT